MTKLLVAQMGHVPRKTGATGTAGEQDMARKVAYYLGRHIPEGWRLHVINADEPDSAYRGDAFVAIHGDGSTNRSVHGASVGYRTPEGKSLAQVWKRAYARRGWTGMWHDDNYTANLSGYYGTGRAVKVGNRRAVVIEVGTMTNATDRKFIDSHHEAIARSIWDAVAPVVAANPYLVTTRDTSMWRDPRAGSGHVRVIPQGRKVRQVGLTSHGFMYVRRWLLKGWVDVRHLRRLS